MNRPLANPSGIPARHADPLMAADSGFTHRQTLAGVVRAHAIAKQTGLPRISFQLVASPDQAGPGISPEREFRMFPAGLT